jgi:RNA polymerase sigma-70 factor, ECF subfamily
MSEPSVRHLLSTPRYGSARAGSAAWQSAFATCYVDLCEYVLRLVGSAEAAQDLVHDLFLQLWDTPDQEHLNRPYLFVAARNRALKYLRHQRVVAAWIERASYEEPPMADSPEDECLRRELDDAVRRAIAELPGRCREIFVLRRRDELSYEEIAARLGVSLGTVKSQMWRATVRLKQRLTPFLAYPRVKDRSSYHLF